MTRRADRRRWAIIGVLAECGPLNAVAIAELLHRNGGAIYYDLMVLEDQGRIVGEWEKPGCTEVFHDPALTGGQPFRPRRRLYRLATDDERRAHGDRRRALEAAKQAGRARPLRVVPQPHGGAA